MPKFKPRPDQVDFTNARYAPVINSVVKFKGKILIVKRSEKLNFFPGFWNGVSGFLDDKKSIKKKVIEEISEELGMKKENLISVKMGNIFHQESPEYKKTWIVHPLLVKVNTHKIKLDFESSEYKWINIKDAKKYKLLPGFDRVIKETKRLTEFS